ncbi:MAG: TetR/AcrR family transcriptional regulator [Gemmatimonadaceae bacterium]
MDAAFAVFGEAGLAAARLEDIAKRAGVSKGTIYLYFPNKEALFEEMVREMVISQIERAELRFAAGDPDTQLREYYRALWSTLRSPIFETMHRLMMCEIRSFPHLAEFYVREVVQRTLRLATSIIRRGVELGEFRDADPDVGARMAHALFVQNAVWAANRTQFAQLTDSRDDVLLDQMTEFVLHALRSPSALSSEPDATGAGLL